MKVHQADDLPIPAPFLGALRAFEPISLDEMADVALLERTETKYVLKNSHLQSALAMIGDDYRVLDIEDIRLNRYRTCYFDTAAFELYLAHHAGKGTRYKIRCRTYVETSQSFLEVKVKGANDRTIKSRTASTQPVSVLTGDAAEFLAKRVPLSPSCYQPTLCNDFLRVTMVSRRLPERLTLDLNMQFRDGGRSVALLGIVVAEVKQAGFSRNSAFMQQMRGMNIRPVPFSKYCVGVSLLFPNVKHNNFKPQLRLIDRLLGGDQDAR